MTVLAAYAFDEGSGTVAADAVGTRDITVVDPGNWGVGQSGSAFSGTGGVRNVPSIVGLETAARTLMFWARSTDGPVLNSRWLVQFYITASDTAAFGIGWIGGNLFMRARIGGANTNLTTPIVDAENWHHFALTYDGVTLRGYRDAVEFSSTALSGTIDSANTINLTDGTNNDLIDNGLRFFDEALSQPEIEALMDEPVVNEIFGDVDIDIDVDVVPVGVVGKVSGAQIAPSVTILATSEMDVGGQAQIASTVALSASGGVGNFGQVSIVETVTITAAGFASGQSSDLCEPLTVVVTGPNLTVDLTGPQLTVEVTAC